MPVLLLFPDDLCDSLLSVGHVFVFLKILAFLSNAVFRLNLALAFRQGIFISHPLVNLALFELELVRDVLVEILVILRRLRSVLHHLRAAHGRVDQVPSTRVTLLLVVSRDQ